MTKLKFIKPRKDKDNKIQNSRELAVVMGLHHLFTLLKIPVWNLVLPIAQELKISCQLRALEGCEPLGATAGNIQNPEERKDTEEKSTDSFPQGF